MTNSKALERQSLLFPMPCCSPVALSGLSTNRLEEDVLRLANTNFISLGSARRELVYRQVKSSEAMSYASSLGSRLSSQSAVRDSNSKIPLPKSPSSPVRNQFFVLNETGDCVPAVCDVSSSARAGSHPAPPVQAPRSPVREIQQGC